MINNRPDTIRLADELKQHGVDHVTQLPWTRDETIITIGEMTDSHLANCIVYHKGIAMLAEAEGSDRLYEACKYVEYKMRLAQAHRQGKE